MAGRPDGERPGGFDSLLDLHMAALRSHQRRNGTTFGFTVNSEQCAKLREEANMFYHRFVCLFVLDEYDGVERDTYHHLGILDLCREFGCEPGDQIALETVRPYVVSMNARVKAMREMTAGKPRNALMHVERGIVSIREHLGRIGKADQINRVPEVELLRDLRAEISATIPEPPQRELQRRLRLALKEERFEDAARIRDQLGEATDDPGGSDADP